MLTVERLHKYALDYAMAGMAGNAEAAKRCLELEAQLQAASPAPMTVGEALAGISQGFLEDACKALASPAPAPAEDSGLREALEYMAKPENYYDEGMLKRPGGYRQVGIVAVSAEVKPWAFAKSALATKGADKGGE